MARKFLTAIDLAKNELQNARIQNLASAPGSPVAGQVYYDTTLTQFGYYNGTTWVYANTVADASTSVKGIVQLAGDIAGTATNVTVTNLHLANDTAVNHKLTSVTDPTSAQDAATKNYVDNKVSAGVSIKAEVIAASTANVSGTYANGTGGVGATLTTAVTTLSIDGVSLANADRVLLAGQSSSFQNGIYTVSGVGSLVVFTRATDTDTAAELNGAQVNTSGAGTVNSASEFVCTGKDNTGRNPIVTVGTDAVIWVQTQSGTIVSGDNVRTARTGNQIVTIDVTSPSAPSNGGTSVGAIGIFRGQYGRLKGDGATTAFAFTFSLTVGVARIIQVYDVSGNLVEPQVGFSGGTVTITFDVAPTAGAEYDVAVLAT